MQKNKQNLFFQSTGDRFIPTKIHKEAFQMENERILGDRSLNNYINLLNDAMLRESSIVRETHKKIMNFTNKKSQKDSFWQNLLLNNCKNNYRQKTQKRRISKKAYKILQAPNLQDNFYLNLVDWSSNDQIAVALQNSLFLWSHYSTQAVKIYQNKLGDLISSLTFFNENIISIANNFGEISFIDIEKNKSIRHFNAHEGRIGSLCWSKNLLASGSKDGCVGIWDIRGGLVNKYKAHSQQICGLKWSPDSRFIASGGNDNKLVVYSHQSKKQLIKFNEHTAAVKAIGWNEKTPSILVSGGGTADRHIRFFSLKTLQQTFHIDTGSQVCNLMFSKVSNRMVTTHGFSLNQINVWDSSDNWQSLQGVRKLQTLTGHNSRVLYLAGSPDGQSIVTGAGDQTLRLWKVFQNQQNYEGLQLENHLDLR